MQQPPPPAPVSRPMTLAEVQELVAAPDLVEQCKSKDKSRVMQKTLDKGTADAIQTLFKAVRAHVTELLDDQYGNYLCQKLLEVAQPDEFESLLRTLEDCDLVKMSGQQHSTRVVQKLILQGASRGKANRLAAALKGHLAELSVNVTSFHVVTQLLDGVAAGMCPAETLTGVFGELCGDEKTVLELAQNQWGICVLKKAIDKARGDVAEQIANYLIPHATTLAAHPYGNYGIQYLFTTDSQTAQWRNACATKLYDVLKTELDSLMCHKNASNVLDKLLTHGPGPIRTEIVKAILKGSGEQTASDRVAALLIDRYGNYVLQSAMQAAQEPFYSLLIQEVGPHLRLILHENEMPSVSPKCTITSQTALDRDRVSRPATKMAQAHPALGINTMSFMPDFMPMRKGGGKGGRGKGKGKGMGKASQQELWMQQQQQQWYMWYAMQQQPWLWMQPPQGQAVDVRGEEDSSKPAKVVGAWPNYTVVPEDS